MASSASSVQTLHPCAISDPKKDSDTNGFDLGQFPEGGTAAWCAVLGSALAQFCCFGYTSAYGVYQDFYTVHYLTNVSASAISWIGSVNAFLVNAFGIIAGILYDRGYFYHLLIGGSILQSFTLLMLSLAQPGQYYQIFLAQGVGLGLAQGMVYVPTVAVVSHYFRRRRTLAMSLVASGSSLGAALHPIMLNYLFNRSVGFANGVRISAAVNGFLLLAACLLIRTRLAPPKYPANYLYVGKGIVRDAPFCLMSIGCLCFQIGLYFPLFYLQLDSSQHGNSETFSFYSLVILNGAGFIGRLSTGFIAARTGVPWLMIISTATGGILILCMIGLGSVPTIVVFGTIFGYFSGIYVALLAPIISLLTHEFSEIGARLGIANAILGIGSLLGGPISGALLTSQYKWWQSAVFGGLVALLGCSLLVTMQFLRTRHSARLTEKGSEAADRDITGAHGPIYKLQH